MQVPIYITGLVMGPLKLDHKGQSQVVCKASGNRARLCISNQGTLSRMWKGNNHQVPETSVCAVHTLPKHGVVNSQTLRQGSANSALQLSRIVTAPRRCPKRSTIQASRVITAPRRCPQRG